ncbi:hypothetical protein CXG81DRAFT_14858 [Caulochytrium protostelioides]|uniref:SHQ1-domain-containing protein n=1 Tax=Caulochytrium protostelioides TaxID=1555241 RepID=A0A4P9X1X6_9FUNG|nr:SHQ1-domain-containing protein [Caulochytrium protostelioides]RKO99185.1 hypothetical protein CXG81DRAFT_14858 [Caulochytrium protostelioides]|eukprot:RKO99185.1 hypothetical protein CXG81DRAFT_14858 [Caulochytrium protostelioides]
MITPSFTLDQDAETVTLRARCPYVKASEIAIHVEGAHLRIHIQPYFLSLSLPAPLVEDGREKGEYDISSGILTVCLPKATPGQHFPDLDLTNTLLFGPKAPGQGLASRRDDSQMAEAESKAETDAEGEAAEEPELEIDWNALQSMPAPFDPADAHGHGYGFMDTHAGFGSQIELLAVEVLTPHLDMGTTDVAARDQARLDFENLSFSSDYYAQDFHEDEEIQRLIAYKPSVREALKRQQALQQRQSEPVQAITLTEAEQALLRKLPCKEILHPDTTWTRRLLLGLVDMVFAMSYDQRVTEEEATVESTWTVAKLSATLSSFVVFDTLDDTLRACFRRAVTFPLYRHWRLVEAVLRDVVLHFKLGRRQLLRDLLAVQRLFDNDERTYVLNRLYIHDYVLWLQQCVTDAQIAALASALNHYVPNKAAVGFRLDEIETMVTDAVAAGELSREAEPDSNATERAVILTD